PRVRFQRVAHTLAELRTNEGHVAEAAKRAAAAGVGVNGTAVDVRTNRVVVHVTHLADAPPATLARLAGEIDADHAVVQEDTAELRPYAIYKNTAIGYGVVEGGQKISRSVSNGAVLCTSAFAVH